MPRKKKIGDSVTVNLSVDMPRIVTDDNSPESLKRCQKTMDFLAKVCAFMISENRDAQACMNMINHIHVVEENNDMIIAFNYGHYDLDHFRVLIFTLLTGYEADMKGYRLNIVEPINFDELENEEAPKLA
jgi:hypothetical protein